MQVPEQRAERLPVIMLVVGIKNEGICDLALQMLMIHLTPLCPSKVAGSTYSLARKKHPPDLTQLSRKNSGKFPYAYVTGVLRFGPGVPSHGSGTMPMWGALFEYYYNKSSAEQRIQNVCDYLASLQEK
jgi:hypothetical protein